MSAKLFVYWNIHKKVFSVLDLSTRLVIAHTKKIKLRNVQFKVSEVGRLRVLHNKRKNVHAGVIGFKSNKTMTGTKQAFYNPYKHESFVNGVGDKIAAAGIALLEVINDRATIV